jgi:hypothetical protein
MTVDRLIHQTFKIDGVLTSVTTAKLSDPTGTYGIKRNDTGAKVIDDGTVIPETSTGVYEYTLEDAVVGVAYTAYIEFVYDGDTFHIEFDLPATSDDYGMLAGYTSLLERVGHHLFGLRSGFSADQTTDIEECIRDGLHDVYAAHSTAPYTTGTITVASGVVTLSGGTFPSWAAVGVLKLSNEYYDVNTRDGDTQITLEDTSVAQATAASYELGRPEYDLPTGFEAIEGDLTYEPGQSDFYPPVRQKHDGEIRRLRQDDPYHDRPVHYGIRTVEFDPTVGSRRRLSLYPTPDAAYVFKARMKLRSTMIDETNQYPIGAEMLSQVIVEACLAAAERNYDEEEGRHTKRFMELLPLAIAADQEVTSPTSLGPDAPRGEDADSIARSVRMGDVTINSVVM